MDAFARAGWEEAALCTSANDLFARHICFYVCVHLCCVSSTEKADITHTETRRRYPWVFS